MDIFREVKKLGLPKGKFAVFGSGPMRAHGIRKSHDIDIVAMPEIHTLLLEKGFKEKVFPSGDVFLVKGPYEIGFHWKYGSYSPKTNYLIKTAEIVNGVPFVRLEEVIKWKKEFGRQKDLKDIKLIEKYLQKRK